MKFPYPNRVQWFILWGSFLGFTTLYYADNPAGEVLDLFLPFVIGTLLLLWVFSRPEAVEGVKSWWVRRRGIVSKTVGIAIGLLILVVAFQAVESAIVAARSRDQARAEAEREAERRELVRVGRMAKWALPGVYENSNDLAVGRRFRDEFPDGEAEELLGLIGLSAASLQTKLKVLEGYREAEDAEELEVRIGRQPFPQNATLTDLLRVKFKRSEASPRASVPEEPRR